MISDGPELLSLSEQACQEVQVDQHPMTYARNLTGMFRLDMPTHQWGIVAASVPVTGGLRQSSLDLRWRCRR
jgi:hypothetical protein